MKKILLAIFSLCALNGFAQIEKGNTLLGGSFGFGTQQHVPNISSNSNGNLQPFIQFGYKKNRTVGFGLDMNFSSNKNDNTNSKSDQFSIAPSVNFNQYHNLKGNFGWFLQEYAGMGFYSVKNFNGTDTQKSNTVSVFAGLTPGIYYTVGEKKNWLLTANVGSLGASYSKQSNADYETWNVNTSLFQSYRFGFAYIFRKG
jgi:hypothetical protein